MSCRGGGVCHAGWGGSCRGGVGHEGVGWVMNGCMSRGKFLKL